MGSGGGPALAADAVAVEPGEDVEESPLAPAGGDDEEDVDGCCC